MNNSQLESKSSVFSTVAIATMSSGLRDDAWHWRNSDVRQFSSEKLHSILNLSPQARNEDDRAALQRVQAELEQRAAQLQGKLGQKK